jgi:hypothetical protein
MVVHFPTSQAIQSRFPLRTSRTEMLTNSSAIKTSAHKGNRASGRLMGSRAAGAWDTHVIDVAEAITLTTPFVDGGEDDFDGDIRRAIFVSKREMRCEGKKVRVRWGIHFGRLAGCGAWGLDWLVKQISEALFRDRLFGQHLNQSTRIFLNDPPQLAHRLLHLQNNNTTMNLISPKKERGNGKLRGGDGT